jgi:transcriptional regulator with XRE-family HTH domain
MEDTKKIFWETVRRLRKQKGYSQEEFASKCKIHRTHMWLIENGKTNITLDNIESIAKQLHIPMDELFKQMK